MSKSIFGGQDTSYDAITTNSITIGSLPYTLPTSDSKVAGYQLQSDAKGNCSWQPAESGAGSLTSLTVSGTSNFTGTMTAGNISASGISATQIQSGTSSILSSSGLTVIAGSNTNPSLAIGSTNNGIFSATGADISFSSQGNQLFEFNSYNLTPVVTGINLGNSSFPWSTLYTQSITATSSSLGAATASSLTSTGTMSIGSNAMTCGALSCSSISAGTNSITCGALSGSAISGLTMTLSVK